MENRQDRISRSTHLNTNNLIRVIQSNSSTHFTKESVSPILKIIFRLNRFRV